MLEVKNLYFGYKKQNVLDGISFSMKEGECISLLGGNGAGKTTLFKCIMGFLDDYKGDIYVNNSKVRKMTAREIARKIAYIPQSQETAFNYLVKDIILMGTNALLHPLQSPRKEEREIVDEILELLDIRHLAERGYAELSGGERQLVLIARALAQKSRILIMDEPTANLDYGNQFMVMKQVKKLTKQGYSVMVSTHNPEHALYFADKVMILNEGKKFLYGEPAVVLTADVIWNIYGVSVEIHSAQTAWGDMEMIAPCLQ